MLPFSAEQFFAVFAAYNEAVWPTQWALTAIAVAIVVLAASRLPHKERWIGSLLGLLWAWTAFAYHVAQFSRINPLAYAFAFVFVLQSTLLFRFAWRTRPTTFEFRHDVHGWAAAGLIYYALLLYPALSIAFGHAYPAMPTFGVPCPTTIFTLGILCIAGGRHSAVLLIIPVFWAVVGGSAAFLLDVPQDLGLILAGIVAIVSTRARRAMNAPRRPTAGRSR